MSKVAESANLNTFSTRKQIFPAPNSNHLWHNYKFCGPVPIFDIDAFVTKISLAKSCHILNSLHAVSNGTQQLKTKETISLRLPRGNLSTQTSTACKDCFPEHVVQTCPKKGYIAEDTKEYAEREGSIFKSTWVSSWTSWHTAVARRSS